MAARTSLILALLVTLLAPAAADELPVPPLPREPGGHDFAAEAGRLYRVAACGGQAALPERFKPRTVEAHCKSLGNRLASYRKQWLDRAAAYIAPLRPADLPRTVVYPFGGGDLMSALAVFPDATEITTISLEAAGDVRNIDRIAPRELGKELDAVKFFIGRLLHEAYSTTKSLQTTATSGLPGLLVFHLTALATHGYEPVSMKFFQLAPDGAIDYLDLAEIALLEDSAAARARAAHDRYRKRTTKVQGWREQVGVLENVEIGFRKLGEPAAPIRIYRHIVANLDDEHQKADGRLLAHLAKKRKVAVMTKAASFLLWFDEFSLIRGYLIANLAWMISDSSGLPPAIAEAAGFVQEPHGVFKGPYFYLGKAPREVPRQFKALWKKSTSKLDFRFGYPDSEKHGHLMVTRPRAK